MTRTLSATRLLLALLLAAANIVPAAQPPAPQSLPAIVLTVSGHAITAEVAATPEQRSVGLMNRFSLKPDSGMLFVFERPEPLSFWMKNTFIPLSIAFLDTNGRILNIEDMAPQTETIHWSKGPALYALEMRKGWFEERGISVGDRIDGAAISRR